MFCVWFFGVFLSRVPEGLRFLDLFFLSMNGGQEWPGFLSSVFFLKKVVEGLKVSV